MGHGRESSFSIGTAAPEAQRALRRALARSWLARVPRNGRTASCGQGRTRLTPRKVGGGGVISGLIQSAGVRPPQGAATAGGAGRGVALALAVRQRDWLSL